eukprot:11986622-Karenia_brevis.AAC.1
MAFAPLGSDDQAAAMALGRADLKWVLSDNDVSEEVQGVIYQAGFCRMSTFIGLGESRTRSATH